MRCLFCLLLVFPLVAYSEDNFTIKLDGAYQNYSMELDSHTFNSENGRVVAASGFYYHTDNPDPQRPVIFFMNGGPSASSIMLHFSGLGPKYFPLRQPDSQDKTLDRSLQESGDSLLTVADLVFVDPPDTGFNPSTTWVDGYASEGEKTPTFNPEDDIDDLYVYLNNFIYRHHLSDRKLYIIGESYGAHRAVALANKFLEDLMIIDGLVLISPTLASKWYSEEPDIYLPTFASILEYHRLIPSQNDTEVRRFAHHHYRSALSLYPEISPEQEKQVVSKVSDLTLIPEGRLRHNGLRISQYDFITAVLEQKQLIFDSYDGRYSKRSEHGSLEDDSFQRELLLLNYAPIVQKFRSWLGDQKYIAPRAYQWKSKQPIFERLDKNPVGEESDIHRMEDFLRAKPNSKIMITCGKYDQVIPCRSVERKTHELRNKFSRRVTLDLYESGHMPYIAPAQREKLVKKIKDMIISDTEGQALSQTALSSYLEDPLQ